MSGQQEQQHAREKLRQADQSQIKRAFGNVVNLPSHRYGLHFDRSDDQETRNLEEHEIGVSECYASCSGIDRR